MIVFVTINYVPCLNVIRLLFQDSVIMSYAEKPEDITREEWMDKLNNVHIQRADMNRLIMNYLVTGDLFCFVSHRVFLDVCRLKCADLCGV